MVSHRKTRRRSGFTLMEVLLVLAIIGVIMTMVVPKVLGRQQHANADATKVSIGGLTQALKLYSLDHSGQFPVSAEGLNSLLKAPGARDPRWRGPYLEKSPSTHGEIPSSTNSLDAGTLKASTSAMPAPTELMAPLTTSETGTPSKRIADQSGGRGVA